MGDDAATATDLVTERRRKRTPVWLLAMSTWAILQFVPAASTLPMSSLGIAAQAASIPVCTTTKHDKTHKSTQRKTSGAARKSAHAKARPTKKSHHAGRSPRGRHTHDRAAMANERGDAGMPDSVAEVPLAPVQPLDPRLRPSTPPVDLSKLNDAQRQHLQWGYALLNSLQFVKGDVPLANGVATLHLGEQFEFLGPLDTEKVLHEVWGNAPGSAAMGMIVPAGASPFEASTWGVVVRYLATGHVATGLSVGGVQPGLTGHAMAADGSAMNGSPAGATPASAVAAAAAAAAKRTAAVTAVRLPGETTATDFAALLPRVQRTTRAPNPTRLAQGYEPVELLRWIAPPLYLPSLQTIHWGKELRFGHAPQTTLNYQIRLLGRRGVLELNFIGTAQQFAELQSHLAQMLTIAQFSPGNRYSDFDARTDYIAPGGLISLITGEPPAPAPPPMATAGGAGSGLTIFGRPWWLALPLPVGIAIFVVVQWRTRRAMQARAAAAGQPPADVALIEPDEA